MRIQFPTGFSLFLSQEEASHVSISEDTITITTPTGTKKTIHVLKSLIVKNEPPESNKEALLNDKTSSSHSPLLGPKIDILEELKKLEDGILDLKTKFMVEKGSGFYIKEEESEEFIRRVKLAAQKCFRSPELKQKMDKKVRPTPTWMEDTARWMEEDMRERIQNGSEARKKKWKLNERKFGNRK